MAVGRNVMVEEMFGEVKISGDVATENILTAVIPGVNHFTHFLHTGILFF